jgi:hypothetical protein
VRRASSPAAQGLGDFHDPIVLLEQGVAGEEANRLTTVGRQLSPDIIA